MTIMFLVEDNLSTHALVEFIEEGCTAVIPIQRIVSNTEGLKQGETVSVLWSNRKEYAAIYLLSGKPYRINFIIFTTRSKLVYPL